MAFKDTYRLEKVYYENMWTLLKSLKALKENPSADTLATVNELLDNAIAENESIILIYKNLGELYAEIAQKFADLQKDLLDLANNLEDWKDEINQKIDDNHNYLMGLIRDLEDRVTSLEGRMDRAEDNIEDLQGRMTTAEGDIDALEGRMDTAEDDIDGLQDDVSDLEHNKQDTLTAGFGIEIDTNNEISVDTNDVQEKLIAGQNITFTPDATDPTKTVIDAQGGANYSAGFGIDINANNEIGVDTSDVQEKLIAGQNITLTPDVTDPTKTVIDAQGGPSYTPGLGIDISANDEISLLGVYPEASSSKSLFSHNDAVGHFAVASNSNYAEFIASANLFDNANLAYKWLASFISSKMFESQANTGSNNIEVKLNQWADKTDFNIHTEIFFSTSAPTSQSITKGNGIAIKKEIRFENGSLVMSNFQTGAGKTIVNYDNADIMIFPVRVTKAYYIFVRVYAYALDSTYDANKLKTFLNSLDFTRLGALCRFSGLLYN